MSAEELFSSDWPVGMSVGIPDEQWIRKELAQGGWYHSWTARPGTYRAG